MMAKRKAILIAISTALTVASMPQTVEARGAGKFIAGAIVGAAIVHAVNSRADSGPRYSDRDYYDDRGYDTSRRYSRNYAAPSEGVKVQKALAALGYYTGQLDGKVDSYACKSSIMQYQQHYGLPQTGILTQDVKSILLYQGEIAELQSYVSNSSSNERDLDTRLQAALKVGGYYNGAIDGVFGPGSQAAVNSYQQQHGTTPNGELSQEQETALINEASQTLTQQMQQSEQQLTMLAPAAQQPTVPNTSANK